MRRTATRPMLAAEFDVTPPRDPGSASRTYLVCSTPRSGSTLLCSGLHRTGLAGTPTEYFNIGFRATLAARWGTRGDLGAYVRELRARRSSANGVFGAKLHWSHLDELRRETNRTARRTVEPSAALTLLAELFPDATYVHMRRADADRQAVSYWKAAYTGAWHRGAGEAAGARPEVPYNFRAISRLRTAILRDDALWAEALARGAVPVVELTYEELVAAYPATISSLVEQVSGDALPAADVPEPELRQQTDEQTEVLLERFRRDSALRRRPPLEDARDVVLDLWVRARTFPYGAVARERLSEVARSRPSR
ncbi:MAG TPA: Stf0 family sulfotransferase [Gaiellaceae bacterium]|nr:Stf0 family sulfotransferase [Gaiellaceae bacterium]